MTQNAKHKCSTETVLFSAKVALRTSLTENFLPKPTTGTKSAFLELSGLVLEALFEAAWPLDEGCDVML